MVRRRDEVPRPHGRAQRADQLGAEPRQARQLRQVAGERPRLVDQPQPFLGLTDPGLAQRRSARPPRRRVRVDRAARGRFRCQGRRSPPPGDRRSDPTEPRRPDGCVDDASRSRGARLLVRVGLDAVRPGALPVRERRLVRVALSRRLHRRVHRPVARLVLHVARARDCAVRPPGLPQLCQPRHRARRRRAKMSKSLRNYPDPMEVFDQHGADAMRWYLLSSPILRGNDFSVTAAGLRDTARQSCCCRCGTRGTSSPCTRTPRACRGASATGSSVGSRRTCSTATSSPRPATSSRTSRGRWTRTTCSGRAARFGRSSRR